VKRRRWRWEGCHCIYITCGEIHKGGFSLIKPFRPAPPVQTCITDQTGPAVSGRRFPVPLYVHCPLSTKHAPDSPHFYYRHLCKFSPWFVPYLTSSLSLPIVAFSSFVGLSGVVDVGVCVVGRGWARR